MTSRYCVPDHYLMLEGSATSASNLEWFLGQWFPDDAAAVRAEQGRYESVSRWVAETEPARSRLLFFPFLYGSNAAPDATACLVGLTAPQTRQRGPGRIRGSDLRAPDPLGPAAESPIDARANPCQRRCGP